MSHRISSLNKINSSVTNYHSIVTNDNENKESTIILWFDSSINSYTYIEQTNNYLEEIDIYVVFLTELEQCLNFIRSIDQEKIFLVTSGFRATQILPHIAKCRQIDAIFIISTEKSKYEHLTSVYSKILGIYTNFDILYASIREEIDFVNKQLLTFSLFNPHQILSEYISKESTEFLWFQLFSHVLFRLSYYQQTKNQMINMCQQYYYDNVREQRLIDEFEKEYRSEEAISWYLKQSFISKLMAKAFRTKNIDQLHMIRFFIGDLTENIAHEHQKIPLSNEQMLTVYRGAKLTKKDLKKLRKNEGTIISINGYLSASRHRSSAFDVAMKPTKRTNVVSVVFEIECNIRELGENIIFADITQYTEYPDRQEVLFDIKTTFRLKNIQRLAQIWLVKLDASNDGQEIVTNYLEEKYIKTEEKSMCIVFGRLMCNLGQYDKAQKYFEQLLRDPNGEDLAWIEFNLGRILDIKNECKMAQKYYNRAYNRIMNAKPSRWKDAVYMLNNLGIILYNQRKNDKALDHYQRALKIQQKFNSFNSVDYTQILSNIAFILNMQGNTNDALNYYKRALKILKKYHSSNKIDIARNLNNIGNILYQNGNYNEAANHYQQALKIQQNICPNGHNNNAHILNNLAVVLNIQGKYDEAFELCQHVLNIQQNLCSSDHISIAGSLNNIGLILYNCGKYDDALHYHQQALIIRRKYYPSGSIDTAESLNNIGNILYQHNKYDQALDYYLETLEIQEKFYPPCHVDIALCLNNIGCVLDRQEKYDEAFHYHQHALKIEQKLYTSGHPNMAYTLNNIGNILCQQGKYEEALDYHQQALQIREKYYPSDHVDIGDSLNNIAMTYTHMQKSKISLDYLQQALAIYEKILPSRHTNIETVKRNIRCITTKK
ncbi:unnamed protein product [Rotaria sp. Silwood1]|nr:unnamed protein product [Rotaria sp. Silwood1]CAF3339148.1 unnamed protein product [Rotaria sp. Silwood1]CAF4694657.1 unnamed protein product [Rotaria sp. Silwood1]